MTYKLFTKSYKALNKGSRRERRLMKPLMAGLSSDTYGLSVPDDGVDAAQDGYESEGSTTSWGSFKSVQSLTGKMKRRRWKRRSMRSSKSDCKSDTEDDDSNVSGSSSKSSFSIPRNRFRLPNPLARSPSSVWTVNHASHSGFLWSAESNQEDGSFPTIYPTSLPKESASVPYSLRSAIGDGSSRQPESVSVMERRTLRPNGSHVNASFWSGFGARTYMEDRFAIDQMGIITSDFPVTMQGTRKASSPRSIADFPTEPISDEKSFHNSNTLAAVPATWFGVFDGHGGAKASQYCCDWLSSYVRNEHAFPHDLGSAMRSAYHTIDEDFVGTGEKDGSTACSCIVLGNERVVCANAGDSRAIVVRKDGSVASLSRDHKPSVPDETRRITELGGKITYVGRWRIEGSLAVSRGIGDTALKPYVTADPEICEMDIGEDDLFLVLGSDGIFDVLENERVAQITIADACLKEDKQIKVISERLRSTAKKLCNKAKKAGSADNVCAIVVDLHSSNN